MDKGSLKIFAIEARRDLMEKVKARLDFLGITSKGVDKKGLNFLSGNVLEIGDNRYKKSSYEDLVKKYESIGYEQLIEESAYIWFNRLVALAYMEANGYIDEKMIFSNGSKIESGIIDDYYEADFFENMSKDEQERIHNLRDKHKTEDMYTMLIEEKCNELHKIMPFMFDKKGGYSDMLFPAGLFTSNSVLVRLREEFEKAKEKNEEGEKVIPVEIIGWLYQYYNQDKREVIYDGSLKKSKITKDYIAPATQLFTPHWIVKYMAENSLGKLAIENLKVSPELKRNWKYYIDNEIDSNIERLNVEDIKIIDPSMGSGHILTYCFDMLYEIYEDLGWSRKDAVLSILKNNLYGLEIDKRAGQLASFALMMKGREKFPRLLKVWDDSEDKLNTLWIDESNEVSEEVRKLIYSNSLKNLEILLDNFIDAKEYGSILKLEKLDNSKLEEELEKLIEAYKKQGQLTLTTNSRDFDLECRKIEKFIQQQKIMSDSYDIAITNPPYMGNGRMNDKLKDYINNYYPDVKSDLFAVFFIKCCEMTKEKGHLGFMSPFVWMFIKSYEELRRLFIEEKTITSLVQLEYSGFEDATVPICTFTLQNCLTNKNGEYIRLSDFKGAKNQPIKTLEAIENKDCGWRYHVNQKEFEKIQGSPIAYWVSDKIREAFEKTQKLNTIAFSDGQILTGNNEKFLRLLWEVNANKIGKDKSWMLHSKGGEYRKWCGNLEWIVLWTEKAKQFYRNDKIARFPKDYILYRKGVTWTLVSTNSNLGVRFLSERESFNKAAATLLFNDENKIYYCLGLLNSKIASILIKIINPTLNNNIIDILKLPFMEITNIKNKIDILVQQNIDIAKEEWDSRETSWDFETLYLAKGDSIESAYNDYCNHWRDNFVTMHKNEEELNKIFIDIYELNDEMDNFIPFEDITLLKKEAEIEEILIPAQHIADIEEKEKTSEGYLYNRGVKLEFDKLELVKQFLSYAVGCIMGRYSIDKKGLIIANSDDVLEADEKNIYIKDKDGEVRHHIENPRFIPDSYGIIPITSEKVFDNDIVTKVIEFVEALYGKENLDKNLEFICNALGRKGDEKYDTTLRNYFLKDFYTDHLQRYQKRPIYWLMNSGKKNGFSALIYLHRYEKNSVARVRTEYLLPYQDKLENLRAYYERITFDDGASAKEKKQAEKSLKELDAMLKELRDYANEVKHIAELKIDLDLDDGVKLNYEKFGKVLKKI